ncbi:MAG TPA: branched-chain amino acid ABC transporter permease [Actinomycetota bacterium]|nr:branched-chain amino acid ABC transporter permease [Actinomycetota bacterium]
MRTGIVVGATAALLGLILILGAGDDAGPNPYIAIGIATGALYGLVALGLVLVYKGSRVFNFAQGEFGTVGAFITFVFLEQVLKVPYYVAFPLGVLGAVLMGLFMERVVVRPLMNSPRITLLVATIAFALLTVGIEIVLFLPEPKTLRPLIAATDAAGNPNGLAVFGYLMEPQNLIVIGILVVLAVVLAYFFSKTDLGLAVLATSQDAFATRVVGIGIERMSRFIWGTAAFLGGLAGILYVPISGTLTPGAMTTGILIPAFTAAVLGGMTSLPGAFLGGIVVGCVQSLANWAGNTYSFTIDETVKPLQSIIPGLPDVAIILVLLIILLARPQGLLGSEA